MDVFTIILMASGLAVAVLVYCSSNPRSVASAPVSGRQHSSRCDQQEFASFPLGAPCDVFTSDHSILWITQVPALRFVVQREPRGSYYTPLKLMYIELARRYPELYDGHTFQQWVEFLTRMGVFRFDDDAIHITAFGRDLLEYLEPATRPQTTQAVSAPGGR